MQRPKWDNFESPEDYHEAMDFYLRFYGLGKTTFRTIRLPDDIERPAFLREQEAIQEEIESGKHDQFIANLQERIEQWIAGLRLDENR